VGEFLRQLTTEAANKDHAAIEGERIKVLVPVALPNQVNHDIHPFISSDVHYFFLKVFCFVVDRMEDVLIANKLA
jgi:hypothetical protein